MARTDDDSWDLASSVGATATMVAAARAMVTRIDGALISDPYAEPLVRAVGVDVFTRLATGELDPSAFDIDDDKNAGMDRMVDNMAVRTKFFDDFFHRRDGRGHRAGGDPGVGPGLARLPAAVARGHRRVRGGPAAGDRLQDQGTRRHRRRAHRGASRGGDRSAIRLARRAEGGGLRPRDSRPRGVPRGCSAICRPRPRTGCWTPSPRSAPRAADWPPRARRPSIRSTSTRRWSGCSWPRSAGANTATTSTGPTSSTSATATSPPTT